MNRLNATIIVLVFLQNVALAQQKGVISVSASVNANQSALAIDGNSTTGWSLGPDDLKREQFLIFSIQTPGEVKETYTLRIYTYN